MRLSYLRMNETQLTDLIVDACKMYGYRVSHFRPAKTDRGWRTPVQGHAGFPDLAIAGHGILLLAELKVGRGTLRPDQEEWRTAIPDDNYRLWTDRNYRQALAELAASARSSKLSAAAEAKTRRSTASPVLDFRSPPE